HLADEVAAVAAVDARGVAAHAAHAVRARALRVAGAARAVSEVLHAAAAAAARKALRAVRVDGARRRAGGAGAAAHEGRARRAARFPLGGVAAHAVGDRALRDGAHLARVAARAVAAEPVDAERAQALAVARAARAVRLRQDARLAATADEALCAVPV